MTTKRREIPLLTNDVVINSVAHALAREHVECTRLETEGWTSQIFHMQLELDDQPQSRIIKLSAIDPLEREAFGENYCREVRFYQKISRLLPVQVPRCYYASFDQRTLKHVLLLEKVEGRPLDWMETGVSLCSALRFVKNIAAVHARWWERPELHELRCKMFFTQLLQAEDALQDARLGVEAMAAAVNGLPRILDSDVWLRYQELWTRQTLPPNTLLHWDSHPGNVLEHDCKQTLIDWQHCSVGNPAWDVARFVVLGLTTEGRREWEETILGHYVDTLRSHGVTAYCFEQCMADYEDAKALQFIQQAVLYGRHRKRDSIHQWIQCVAPRVIAALDEPGSPLAQMRIPAAPSLHH